MRIRFWTATLAATFLMWAITASGSVTYARIKTDFQHPVVINSETFPPGHYVFQQIHSKTNSPIFRVTDPQGNNLTLTSIAIKVQVPQRASNYSPPAAQDTEVILQKVGGNYYLHRIWIQGRTRGWEFEIPDSVKAQIGEMNEESIPGSYDEAEDVADQRYGEATMQTNAVNAAGKSNQLTSLTGCLKRRSSPDSFYIESSGGKQTRIQPAWNLFVEMANQANHTVRLVGHWPAKKAEANVAHSHGNTFVGSDTHAVQAKDVFHADRIDVISTICQK